MTAARARVLSQPRRRRAARRWWPRRERQPGRAAAGARQAGVLYAGAPWRPRGCATRRRPRACWRGWHARWPATPPAQRLARLLAAEIALAAGRSRRAALRLVDAGSRGRPELLLAAQAQVQRGPGRARRRSGCRPGWRRSRAMPRPGSCWRRPTRRRASRCARCAPRPRRTWRSSTTRRRWTASRRRRTWCARGGGGGDHIEASIIDTRARAGGITSSRTGARALTRSPCRAAV